MPFCLNMTKISPGSLPTDLRNLSKGTKGTNERTYVMQTFMHFSRAFSALSSQKDNQKWISVGNITQIYGTLSTKLDARGIVWNYFILLNRFYASALRKIQVTE